MMQESTITVLVTGGRKLHEHLALEAGATVEMAARRAGVLNNAQIYIKRDTGVMESVDPSGRATVVLQDGDTIAAIPSFNPFSEFTG